MTHNKIFWHKNIQSKYGNLRAKHSVQNINLCIFLQMNSFITIFPKFFNAFASIVSIVVFPSVQKFVIIRYSGIEIFEINVRIWSRKYSGETICLAEFFFWFHQCSNVHWWQVFQDCVLEKQRIFKTNFIDF